MEQMKSSGIDKARQRIEERVCIGKERESMATIKETIQMITDKELRELAKINPEEIARKVNDADMLSVLQETLEKLRERRPTERSERSQRYAVTITEMEKVVAYFKTWIVDKKGD